RRLLPEKAVEDWSDPSGQLLLVEIQLPEALAGKRLHDLGIPGQARLVAVTRAGVPRLDVAELVGQEGDALHVAVKKEALEELETMLGGGS
ncbi:MAG TPA: TrkA C-terminal domain-containing protein, partial [Acidimicrobiales bacterium]|nr:TrkA C-terminal domain-containing protein [Acidimicrobiales bacterium]